MSSLRTSYLLTTSSRAGPRAPWYHYLSGPRAPWYHYLGGPRAPWYHYLGGPRVHATNTFKEINDNVLQH